MKSSNHEATSTTVDIEVAAPNDHKWIDGDDLFGVNLNDGMDELTEISDIETGSSDDDLVVHELGDDLVDVNLDDDVDEMTEESDIETCLSGNDLVASEPGDDLVDVNLDDDGDELTEKSDVETDASDDDLTALEIEVEAFRVALLATLGANNEMDPRLRRIACDFAFAQSERARTGRPLLVVSTIEIFGHLGDIRADIRWAEDAARRRENHETCVSWEDSEKKRKQMRWKRSYLTYTIIISHFAMMVYEFYLSDWTAEPMKTNKSFGPSSDVMFRAGSMRAFDMIQNGNWYRLLTATFCHAGLIHYIANDLGICHLGSIFEANHGKIWLALVYFIPAVAANVLSALFHPSGVSLGASGALFGLYGACLADIVVNWKLMFLVFKDHPGVSKRYLKLKRACFIFLEVIGNMAFGLIPMIDNFAHLGGVFYGSLIGYCILQPLPLSFFGKRKRSSSTCRSVVSRFIAAAIMISAVAYSSVKLSQSDGITVPYPLVNYYISGYPI
ncbi:unnamed protein product [Cylindrotheca closterium]|uniref:rhomboid protease n=1 Tax=Cylindrotheca closterium TaxID=2856 RepID=A0AAD2CB62_9STRA|nr:unnamed protein product [Cylindrotheca closterium]